MVAAGEYGQWAGMYHPRKFWLQLAVLPQWQGRGFGAAFYDHMLGALAALEPISIRSDAREDMARSRRFLEDRGFTETMRSWESRLDVAAFDPAPFAGAEEKARAHGIEVRSLAELASDPERDRKVYDLVWAVEEDVPRSEPEFTPVPFEQWRVKELANPNLIAEGYFVALDGGRYVGVSQLWRSQGTEMLETGLTGVRREYRRRGIALALKLRALEYARALGCPTIRTWNESRNRGMLSINEALGFVKQPAWIEFAKVIRDERDD
jgi:GNAT superfamily N-acetyltransferase